MPDLLAEGSEPDQNWRRPLPAKSIILGRVQKCDWETPWDEHISRRHAQLQWKDGKLQVVHLPEGKNPIFYHGKELREFTLGVGEHFVIGKTMFKVVDSENERTPTGDSPVPIDELTCSFQELKNIRFGDAGDRIEALAKLPAMIRLSPSDEELESRVLEVLLDGILLADAAAVVHMNTASPSEPLTVRRRLGRGGRLVDLKPSRRLVYEAIRKRRLPVMHSWNSSNQSSGDFTASAEVDWAICAPLPDVPAPGWAP
ncbi:MAG: FHA domain-containing protein, partial [Planctomycetes bacterium]|nr:FHA domain-containing protein [Planctomycetota bacterium]